MRTSRLPTPLAALAGAAATVAVGAAALAATSHGEGHDPAAYARHHPGAFVPELGGEYAFATIAEIVAALLADPGTDWSRVDVAALRDHLVDMSRVTLRTDVRAEPIEGGAAFLVTGEDPATVASVRRVARDHAATMGGAEVDGFAPSFAASEIEGGVRVEVVTDSEAGAATVRALGFHGLLALGDHHRVHHLAIATGASPH